MAALACVALTGCAGLMVPNTVITGSIGGQPFSIKAPKDASIGSLHVTAATNGTVSITISNYTAKMNPEIVTLSGEVFVKSINAIGEQVGNAAGAAAKAAAK